MNVPVNAMCANCAYLHGNRCKNEEATVFGELVGLSDRCDQWSADVHTCPQCAGYADRGFSREFPPSPYLCSQCQEGIMTEPVAEYANSKQVGGQHYKRLEPQPWDVISSWGLGFLEGNCLKYLARWRYKGNGVQDLLKARHYLDKLIEEEQAKDAEIRG